MYAGAVLTIEARISMLILNAVQLEQEASAAFKGYISFYAGVFGCWPRLEQHS